VNTREVVIVSGARTPIGKFGGTLAGSDAVSIGAHALRHAVERSGIDPDRVDEAVVGHARQAMNGPNPGRLMALGAGLGNRVHTQTVQQACVSSLKALILAVQSIRLGDSDVVAVGGSEHMSSIPYYVPNMRWGHRMGDDSLIDGLSRDGFRDPLTGKHMGALADAWAERFGITRDDQDAYALRSQQRARDAAEGGFAAKTIAPIEVKGRRGPVTVAEDEHPRADTTMESLGKLPAVFVDNGSVTAGNASGITDGAAAMVVAGADVAERLGLAPLAYVRGYAVRAVEPQDYGLAVAPASDAALKSAGVGYDDLSVIEMNEAFAIQVLAACRLMGIDAERTNPNGGAIALGHPVGASGARVAYYAAMQLAETNDRWGLATICGNGGQAGSVVLERV
jgi:acetyl-CoA C-acetyltransferase